MPDSTPGPEMPPTALPPRWLRLSIWIGAGCFIAALLLSAMFDRKIRVLHALQAVICIAVIALTRRNSAWGFGAGCLIAAVWNHTNLFVTTFFAAGSGSWVAGCRPAGSSAPTCSWR